jgi:uncharacterized protein YlxW (UPF0749 family)
VKNVGKNHLNFTVITMVIGLMVAIQYQTVQEPVVRDTRDMWELRKDLLLEKELHSKLLQEIRSNEDKIAQYESKRKQGKEIVLRETLEELKIQVGLTDISGPGIKLSISPIEEEMLLGKPVPTISPDLLKRLINELNRYGATYISISGHRLINTSVIRDINNDTKIDGHSLKKLPIEINVVTESLDMAEKLYNRMQGSESAEDLFRFDSLRVTIMKPSQNITVPAYQDTIRVTNMQPVDKDKGGN